MRYVDVSTSTLRSMLAALTMLGVMSRQRAAIEQELRVRALAEAIESQLGEWALRWCARGGRS